MSFTDPMTFVDGERFTKAQANTYIHDNLEALKNPPTSVFVAVGRATDYSTTSTSFTDVDGTNLALSITTTGNGAGGNADVTIWICGTVYSSTSIRIYFRLLEDGVSLNADDGWFYSEGSGTRPIGAEFLRVNVTPGAHTYKLQYKVSGGTGVLLANAGTSTRDCRFQFGVREKS
jgi:carbon monoxide dehydrogenase subunit G